jgi:hypothetical protein
MSRNEVLDVKIRALVIELVESAPPAPTPSAIESKHWGPHRTQMRRPRTRRLVIAASVGVAAVIAAVLVAVLLPSVGERPPVAAAAQLRLIAANAANQVVPPLQRGQWLETQAQGLWSMDLEYLGQGGAIPVSGAEATAAVTTTQWSNNFGESCYSLNIGRAEFASPANEAAWDAAGLLNSPDQRQRDNPLANPDQCGISTTSNANNGTGLQSGAGTTNVSSLPRDPSTLAHELTIGTTGIQGLDHLFISPGQNPGFQRVVALLTTDLTDQTPAFYSALYDALALMPGIHALAETRTHTGSTGLGFDVPSNTLADATTIVVDPANGALLEARNLWAFGPNDPFNAFVAPQSPFEKEGGTLHNVIQWLDPIGSTRVVETSALPSALAQEAGPLPTALITATANPGVSTQAIDALESQVLNQFSSPNTGAGIDSEERTSPEALTFTFFGPVSQVDAVAHALRSSNLFDSEVVDNGDG